MKVVNKPIELISKTNFEGVITPVKFRFQGEDEAWREVKIDRIITRELNKLAGNKIWVYECQSLMNDIIILYQLRYEIESCKWKLFKM